LTNRLLVVSPESDLDRPDSRPCQQRPQALDTRRLGQVGLFEMKPMRFQGREQGFNTPAQGLFCHRRVGVTVAGNEQPVAVLQALGAEKDPMAPQPAWLTQHPTLSEPQILEFLHKGRGPARRCQRDVGCETQAKRDTVRQQKPEPVAPDEFPIRPQLGNPSCGKGLLPVRQQGHALSRVGMAGFGQGGPKQRDGQTVVGHAQYQQIDLHASQLPVGAVERQDPGTLLGQQRGHGAGDVGLIDDALAKKAL